MRHYGPAAQPGPLGKLFALVAGAALLLMGFMFSVVLVAIVAVAGLAAWVWFWWKTRKLRQALRDHPPGGLVIDGEVIVVDEFHGEEQSAMPRDPPAR